MILKEVFKMFTSRKEQKEMQTQIIESAGKIYNYLSDKGEVTINKLRKDMDLDDNFTYMGLGWLSREDKISYTQKPKSVTVKLV
ncbi:TPA: hypothetical protein CPT83_02110 [Candidatus Gastranaerophilales bacterium HUM_1]|nr:MAG TPA: hypothetical protein CPT83_02110 [Candidatus Gastranaerophilales bacterium HUM_1]